MPGAPGYETAIREFVRAEIEPFADEIQVDQMGNLTAIRRGRSGKRVMTAAHMDEISFIVNHIGKNGFLRFYPLGGFDPKTLTSMRVWVHGKETLPGVMGSKPIHIMTQEERGKKLKLDDYYIDLGLPAETVRELVPIGSVVTRQGDLVKMGDCVVGKSLDNRVSVFVQTEALRELAGKDLPHDVYAVFTTQEEVGLRGAKVATLNINPDFGICLDTTIAFDTPDAKPREKVTALGAGTGIKIMDASTICDRRMIAFMKQQAEKHDIKWQPELLKAGGTDTSALQLMAHDGGAICGAVSIPTRNIHQTVEMCHHADIRASIDLFKNCLLELDAFDWAI